MSSKYFLILFLFSLIPLRFVGSSEIINFQVIVHPDNHCRSIRRIRLANLFLKKTKFWEDGTPAQPLDLSQSSPIRERFSEKVLDRSISAVKNYWQQMIFSGRDVPPPEFDSEQKV